MGLRHPAAMTQPPQLMMRRTLQGTWQTWRKLISLWHWVRPATWRQSLKAPASLATKARKKAV